MKDINKLIKRKLKEQLDYSGSERMDPRLEKKLADPNSMFAKNPAFKRGAADVQKLFSKSFNEILSRIRRNLGKETLTQSELVSAISGNVFRNVARIQELENRYRDQLAEIAISETLNEMEVSDDTFEINASLGRPSSEVVKKMRKEKAKIETKLSPKEQEVLEKNMFKRDIINALIAGVARKTHYIYEKPEVKAQLDELDPELYTLYNETVPYIDAMYFINEDNMEAAAKGDGILAAVDVNDVPDPDGEEGDTKTSINATAFIFPILCHEISKGIEEALARQGYPSDTDMANMTLSQTDTLKSETDALRIGPPILEKIRKILPIELFDKSEIGLIRFFFVELYKIHENDFIDLMKYVISDTASDQNYAKREFEELVEKARVSKQRYIDYLMSQYDEDEEEFDDGGLGDQDGEDDSYSGGKQGGFDPNDYVNVNLKDLMKDLRDKNMLN
jgi:hypothetical protein